MKTSTTRTLNPLPFQDMEPHRFEDLVRQLAYEMRPWKSLEAVGRAGSDEGIDIRAIEAVSPVLDDDAESTGEYDLTRERLWIFQCKREKSLAAKRVRTVVEESLVSLSAAPHGFVLAIACDVTKKSRDAFRDEMVKRRIEQFELWTRGELEDLLFQPRNDHLLFAFFGISLATRRRSTVTESRAEITKKKQLASLIGDKDSPLVVLRDPTDGHPPLEPPGANPSRRLLCYALSTRRPGYLTVLHSEHLATMTPARDHWDAIFDYDLLAERIENDLRDLDAWSVEPAPRNSIFFAPDDPHPARAFYYKYISPRDRMNLEVIRFVSLARIMAIDPIGDGYHPIPHILCDFGDASPFEPVKRYYITKDARLTYTCAEDMRIEIFPKPLPPYNAAVPARFDQTDTTRATLSDQTGAQLLGFLDEIAALRNANLLEMPSNEACTTLLTAPTITDFLAWREGVGLPTLSGFVERLRAAGHSARVSVYSVPGAQPEEAYEELSLHVGFDVSNSWLRTDGSITISATSYAWRLVADPPAPSSRSEPRKSTYEPSTMSAPTASELEAEVLSMLTRLGTGFLSVKSTS